MGKINDTSQYPVDGTVTGSDYVIGTDGDDPSLVTRNFLMSDIAAYVAGTITTPTLQVVLDNGNAATQSLNLTGTATATTVNSTNIVNTAQVDTLSFYITGAFYDRNNLPGTLGQVLVSEGAGVAWKNPVGDLGQVSVTVPAADFNLLNTVPYALIPSPGAGKAIQIVSASLRMVYNSSPYSFQATGIEIEVSPGSPQVFITNSNVNVTSSQFVALTPVSSGAIAENSAVKLSAPAPQSGTSGDSDVTIDLLYRIITV